MLPQPVGISHQGHTMVSEFALASIVYFLVVLGFVSQDLSVQLCSIIFEKS